MFDVICAWNFSYIFFLLTCFVFLDSTHDLCIGLVNESVSCCCFKIEIRWWLFFHPSVLGAVLSGYATLESLQWRREQIKSSLPVFSILIRFEIRFYKNSDCDVIASFSNVVSYSTRARHDRMSSSFAEFFKICFFFFLVVVLKNGFFVFVNLLYSWRSSFARLVSKSILYICSFMIVYVLFEMYVF